MIEEAAGVRMYECKKQGAIRTIEKKETKVFEICKVDFFNNCIIRNFFSEKVLLTYRFI